MGFRRYVGTWGRLNPTPPWYHRLMPYKNLDTKRQYQLEWMWRRRSAWILANGPCRWCGSVSNLQVSWRNPANKTVKVSGIWSRSDAKRAELLANCEVLCEKCHKRKIAIWHAVKAALNRKQDDEEAPGH